MRERPSRSRGPRARAGSRTRSGAPAAATRPAARRSGPNGSGVAARTTAPGPPGRFTGRAVILGVVLLALALSYVFPVRVYLAQQAEIGELRASQERQRAHLEELEAEAARWADDDYIRIQARQRLYFGEPGEILLITVWDDEDTAPDRPDEAELPAPPNTWWDTLWTSVESANRATSVAAEAEPGDAEPGDAGEAEPGDAAEPDRGGG